MFLHRNDQKMTTFNYFGPRILFVRPERTVGNNGLKQVDHILILVCKHFVNYITLQFLSLSYV